MFWLHLIIFTVLLSLIFSFLIPLSFCCYFFLKNCIKGEIVWTPAIVSLGLFFSIFGVYIVIGFASPTLSSYVSHVLNESLASSIGGGLVIDLLFTGLSNIYRNKNTLPLRYKFYFIFMTYKNRNDYEGLQDRLNKLSSQEYYQLYQYYFDNVDPVKMESSMRFDGFKSSLRIPKKFITFFIFKVLAPSINSMPLTA